MNNTKHNDGGGAARQASLSFAALNTYIERHLVTPTERRAGGADWVEWGDGNAYPDYLNELYQTVPTLRSVINGCADYIAGDDCRAEVEGLKPGTLNRHGDTAFEVVGALARSWETYGGFALQVIRDYTGAVAEVYPVDMRYLRTDKECSTFWYCEDWRKRRDALVYPAFMAVLPWEQLTEEERERQASSILYVKSSGGQVYPEPPYAASVKSCEIERCIDDYHLNAINNGFVGSMLVNFNNGVPEDHIKEEIERAFNDKFAGHANAGRIVFSWNRDKETATSIETPTIEDFGDRYKALSEHSRQQIFTAFRANPNLFGIPTEGNGFANEQYEESFKLFNRTQVLPVQRAITDALSKVFGREGVVTIVPFSLEGETERNIM